jgi:competence protein ComEC
VRVPSVLLAIPLLAGAVAGILLVDSVPGSVGLSAAAAAALSVLAAAAAVADESPFDATLAIVVGTAMAGLSLGHSAAREHYEYQPPVAVGEPVALEGWLREDAAPTAAGAGVTLDVVRAAVAGREPVALERGVGVRLAVAGAGAAGAAGEWRAGRLLRVTAIVRPPATYRNFGVPDESRALARRGISLVGTVKSAALVDVARKGGALGEAAGVVRAWARQRLRDLIGRRSARSAAIATAILIGDRSGIPDEDERRLQAAGTYHVIAISGGNIAILTALVLFLLRAAMVPARLAHAVTILALLFYGQLTGAPPSVARAITAAVVYLAARVIDHRGPALNALAVAAVGAVALFPFAVLDPGFTLSFGATLGILLGTPRLVGPARTRRGPLVTRAARLAAWSLVALCAATLCAEAALLPVGATLFARVTAAGLLLNFLAIPLMTIVQVASLAALASARMPRVAEVAAQVSHLSTVGLVESARLLDVAPWLSIDVVPPALWVVGLYYGACVVWLCRWRLGERLAALALGLAIGAILFSPSIAQRGTSLPSPRGMLRVAFLDVGQGDATLARLPGGRTLLVDAAGLPGSSFDAGERVVAPALRALGVRKIDTLIVTHADPDHIGGAASIVHRFAPRTVWEGIPVPPNPALRELADLASSGSAVWRTVQAGDAERIDEVDIRIWHPQPPDWERQRVRNDDSVVVELRHGDVSILLTGDIEREAEHRLTPILSLAPLVVLKAPHHGSATSSSEAFIRAARPKAVVFSAGRRNPFGHPHPAVLARYRAAGVEMFRTDEDGAVVVDTDGKTVKVRTCSGREASLSR